MRLYSIVPTSKSSLSKTAKREPLDLYQTYVFRRHRTLHWNVSGDALFKPFVLSIRYPFSFTVHNNDIEAPVPSD